MRYNCIFLIIFLMIYLTGIQVSYADWRDPMQPTDPTLSSESSFSDWNLSAIMISSTQRIAVINGQIVKVGDFVMDEKVMSIEPNTVQLSGQNGNITLFLLDKSIKHALP